MIVVGLTGSVASGKSTLAALLAELGATVLSADETVRELEARGGAAFRDIVDRFGRAILNRSGEIDRHALGEIVFSDEQARRDLEAIVHPLVHEETLARLRHARARGDEVAVLEIPLLFEVDGRTRYHLDAVIALEVSEDVALKRLVEERGLDEEAARRRLSALPPGPDRLVGADFIVVNTGSKAELEEMAHRAFAFITSLPGGAWA